LAEVAKAAANRATHIRARTQDDEFYAKLLTDYLTKFKKASRAEISQLLLDKLSDALAHKKSMKINNLFTKLRRKGVILMSARPSFPVGGS
jgi:ATP-dependent DNA helicase RecG